MVELRETVLGSCWFSFSVTDVLFTHRGLCDGVFDGEDGRGEITQWLISNHRSLLILMQMFGPYGGLSGGLSAV